MAPVKIYVSKPTCEGCGCPDYIDNRMKSTMTSMAHGHKLLWGERYCLYGKKVKRMQKSVAGLPGWCPRWNRHPVIQVYTRRSPDYFERKLRSRIAAPKAADYKLCRVTATTLTPLQFVNLLRKRDSDPMELLGWNIKRYDVVEIDVGLARHYIWLGSEGWRQTYSFNPEESDRCVYGTFSLLPHQDIDPERYSKDTTTFRELGIGQVNGYFAGGVFRSRWLDNPPYEDNECCQRVEAMLDTLRTGGPLQSIEALYNFCWNHCWARIEEDESSQRVDMYRFGFWMADGRYRYYLVLTPYEDSPLNIQVFCYPAP